MAAADLDREAADIAALIGGKRVGIVRRNRIGELLIEFDDGTRLFVDWTPRGLDVSITGGTDTDASAN